MAMPRASSVPVLATLSLLPVAPRSHDIRLGQLTIPGSRWRYEADFGKKLTDNITVSGDAASFMTQHGGGDCTNNVPATVRFYFTSPSASGPSTGQPPAGFYTHFWWSNPMHLVLDSANESGTITASMADPNEWSDWNGQGGGSSPAVLEAFIEATHRVQSIGLSFGGVCFFETGVTPTPNTFTGEQFSSSFNAG